VTLYWPAGEPDGVNAPRLHALVIGVGDYHHLGLNPARPATFLSDLPPLSITTPAARRLAGWLETRYTNTDRPLGSVELLLSPAETMQRADGSDVDVEDATMANIEAAFARWYKRCDTDENNIALLYFAGHGISTMASQFLLPSDFGNPDLPDEWKNCIDGTGLQSGMAKCEANTQLFFIDACRDTPISALTQRNPHGNPLVTADLNDKVDLSAAFLAASEGRKAYGRDGEETYFCKALVMCLEGVAARKSGPEWRVDTSNLASSLAAVVDIMAQTENLPLSCHCPAIKPVVLHVPPEPKVLVKVDCAPKERNNQATITLTQNQTVVTSPAGQARPWSAELSEGDVTLAATFQTFVSQELTDRLVPPTYSWDPPL
jgi:hypothetical protein